MRSTSLNAAVDCIISKEGVGVVVVKNQAGRRARVRRLLDQSYNQRWFAVSDCRHHTSSPWL